MRDEPPELAPVNKAVRSRPAPELGDDSACHPSGDALGPCGVASIQDGKRKRLYVWGLHPILPISRATSTRPERALNSQSASYGPQNLAGSRGLASRVFRDRAMPQTILLQRERPDNPAAERKDQTPDHRLASLAVSTTSRVTSSMRRARASLNLHCSLSQKL